MKKTARNSFKSFVGLTLCVLSIALVTTTARGENTKHQDGYSVQYNAFNSTFLTAENAKAYKIVRSKNRAVINISVEQTSEPGANVESQKAITAQVRGTAVSLDQREQKLHFKKITEGDAIYYIATVDFTNEETLRFDIQVHPHGGNNVIEIEFSQQFFAD